MLLLRVRRMGIAAALVAIAGVLGCSRDTRSGEARKTCAKDEVPSVAKNDKKASHDLSAGMQADLISMLAARLKAAKKSRALGQVARKADRAWAMQPKEHEDRLELFFQDYRALLPAGELLSGRVRRRGVQLRTTQGWSVAIMGMPNDWLTKDIAPRTHVLLNNLQAERELSLALGTQLRESLSFESDYSLMQALWSTDFTQERSLQKMSLGEAIKYVLLAEIKAACAPDVASEGVKEVVGPSAKGFLFGDPANGKELDLFLYGPTWAVTVVVVAGESGSVSGAEDRLLHSIISSFDLHGRESPADDMVRGGHEYLQNAPDGLKHLAGLMLTSAESYRAEPGGQEDLVSLRDQISRLLIRNLREEDKPEVRAAAAATVGFLRDRRALPYLLDACGDSEPRVRAEAVCALGLIGTSKPEVIEAVRKLTEDDALQVRDKATKALKRLARD